jgi:hypothetical protein
MSTLEVTNYMPLQLWINATFHSTFEGRTRVQRMHEERDSSKYEVARSGVVCLERLTTPSPPLSLSGHAFFFFSLLLDYLVAVMYYIQLGTEKFGDK